MWARIGFSLCHDVNYWGPSNRELCSLSHCLNSELLHRDAGSAFQPLATIRREVLVSQHRRRGGKRKSMICSIVDAYGCPDGCTPDIWLPDGWCHGATTIHFCWPFPGANLEVTDMLTNFSPWHVLPPFQIICRLTFLTSNLTTHFIQKIYTNVVKFEPFFKNSY